MANCETQILDDLIVKSRRKMLALGGTALAGIVLGQAKSVQAASYSDADILNFALNLEYLEANFYYLCAFGCTIDQPNAAAIAAGAPTGGIPITGSVGTAGTVSGGSQVAFSTIEAASYANETAIEEGKHVFFLQGALGASAVAQPAINLDSAWQTLGQAALGSAGANFTPYTNDETFLLGAFVFEDVGVTAYHGAASLLTSSGNLSAAAGILAVEAYHAGLIRTTINAVDPSGSLGLIAATNAIATLRATLAGQVAPSPASAYDTVPDDFGLATFSVALGGGASTTATRIVDADATNSIAFARDTSQILNIVTGGSSFSSSTNTIASPATGVFFPNGLNAGPNGFK
jgi:Ferritin-like domain